MNQRLQSLFVVLSCVAGVHCGADPYPDRSLQIRASLHARLRLRQADVRNLVSPAGFLLRRLLSEAAAARPPLLAKVVL